MSPQETTVMVDGVPIPAVPGQSVAGVLQAAGITAWRRDPSSGELRGAYCGMGVCFECELTIDDRPGMRACMTHVVAGMTISTEEGSSDVDS